MSPKAVVIVSGGMDSSTLAYWAMVNEFELSILSFDYGQKHRKELIYAGLLAKRLDQPHRVVDLKSITELIAGSNSSLVTKSEVPEGHYSAETMAQTVVPNRNAIMLSIAYGHAIAIGAKKVLFGAHEGDRAQYPDCRPPFVEALNHALLIGNEGFGAPDIYAPFLYLTKTEIAKIGSTLGVPFELTWSCYKGGEKHCGRCGTCVERREAMHNAGVEDKTQYEDAEYWKEAVAEFNKTH